ncbi:uncharacterized protein PAC_20134 [Phialocephala subalpina]|uniref:Carrier domain-containing protein n=1 Tax=Phialocephala subalpina TaxID=576137 RepID=A0A1L7XYS9_9HELO|nr:uncharacterized protein PAC_20134 [Phialocephala subalpina]
MSQITLSPDLEYWTERLRDKEQCLFPVLDDGVQRPAKETQRTDVQAPHLEKILGFCQNYELRLSTVFQAAWGLVVRSYTGTDDVIFGYQHEHFKTFPCHVNLVRESGLQHALNAIEISYARDSSHQEFQRRDLESALKFGEEGLFNTEVRYRESTPNGRSSPQHQDHVERGESDDYDASPITVEISTDLTSKSLRIHLRYHVSYLSTGQAANVASALERALICVITGIHQNVGEQHLFSDHHRHQVDKWNQFRPESQNMTFHDAISTQVRAQPDAPAIDAWDEKLTYRELDDLSSTLARHLVQLGVQSGIFVPLVFEKSAWWVVALLAVSKSGAAFVPVDASQPVLRLKEIMDDVKPSLLLSSVQHADLLADCVKTTVVVSRSTLETLWTRSAILPELPVVEHTSAAYVMYTSGSTGRPKGAVLQHGGYLSALLCWIEGTNLVPGQRALQSSSYAWSVCIIEAISVLWHGACLCVPSDYQKQNALTEVFKDMHITWAILSPSIVKTIEREKVRHLENLILCGEPVAKEVVARWASEKTRVWVAWAATECLALARPDNFTADSNVQNLGPSKGVCRVVEVGNHERQVPIGAVGEIVTHAPWIADGYLNDPERTAATFLDRPDWLDGRPSSYGSRWYKVGDLVRQNSDGSLMLAGRGDNMVKIRGQRFDMADVERFTGTDAQIRNSLPILPKMGICKHRLAAVVSLHRFTTSADEVGGGIVLLKGSELRDAASWVSQFREDLSRRVPSYMIPSLWVMLKAFPLTITGKIDRVSLRRFIEKMDVETFESIATLGIESEPPVTPLEKRLAEVWAEVLNLPLDKVGRNTPFITLGGDSILAMIIGARCNKDGLCIRAQDILKYGTIAELASKASLGEEEQTAQAAKLAKQYVALHQKMKETLHQVIPCTDNVEDAYPASPMQTGMLLSKARMTGDYNTSSIYEVLPSRIKHAPSIERLQNAWQQVVNRHSILRTFFVESVSQSGSFDQIVLRNYDVLKTTTVWTGINTTSIDDVIRTFDGNPFKNYPDFQPPHNFTILETTAGRVFCRLNAEHTLVDGMSLAVIVRDLRLAYDGKLPLQPVPLYSSYITLLQEVVCSIDNRYWKSYLKDMHPCILPTLSYNLSREPPKSESRSITVDIKNSHHLLKFCQSQEITLSALFRTIWGLILRSYTGSDEVCFGYITSGRDLPIAGVEEIVGTFINMLVCRLKLSEMSLVKDIIATAKTDYLNSLPHQHASLAQIQHVLGLYGQQLFNTSMTILKQVPLDSGESPSITFDNIHEWSPNEYDLDVQVWVSSTNVAMELWYRTEAISNEHAHNIASTFSQAIDTITDDFDQRIGQLDLFSHHHRRQVWDWNARLPESIDVCLHDLISEHADVRPNEIAITSWDRDFTYEQLEEYSGRLAHHLVSHGVGPEVHVLLCFEKSAIAIVAMLGVLKAGGVCVSIDPTHPTQRLQRIIADTRPLCCLISKLHRGLFEAQGLKGLVKHVVTADEAPFASSKLPESTPKKPRTTVTAKNAAFILFTSGSTGTPKGIVHEHRTVASSLHHHGLAMNIGIDSRTLQFSAFVFDVSITEIFMALTRGGVLCIPSEHERMNCLESAITRMGANWAHLTPTVASLLDPDKVPTLKHMALAGEPLKRVNVTEWASRLELVNLYGPAECCLATTLRVGLVADDRTDNIGRAVGLLVWIVDPKNTDRLVPVGSVGELLLEGPNVAREYLRDRERTLQFFIENPAWLGDEKTTPPRRFYRSGDLARYNGDGSIQILGRIDTQVKLHGQRVELGEIEYQAKVNLTTHNLVNMAVVYAKGDHPGGGLLVAFLEFEEKEKEVDEDQLIISISLRLKNILVKLDSHLAETLPSYMVPSIYVPLNAMPLLTAGKIDRGKLVSIIKRLSPKDVALYSLSEFQAEKVQPRSRLERTLQTLWSQVLAIQAKSIGVDDNFFRMGGDSVVAMKLSAAGREVGITITVANIFQNPKLSDMAAMVRPFSERTLHELESQYGIPKTSVVAVYPATPLQEGMILLSSRESNAYTVQHVLPLPVNINIQQFKLVWTLLYKEYPILRTRIINIERTIGSMQVVVNEELSWLTGTSLRKYLECDQSDTMEYGQSLVRFALIEDDAKRYFVLTAHHSIFDKSSISVLFSEAERFYRSVMVDEQHSFTSQALTYKSFATDVFNMDVSEAEVFWQEQFSDLSFSTFPKLPIGHRPSATETLNNFIPCPLSSEQKFSVQTTIRAAWALLLAQYSDSQANVVFGMTLDGRQSGLDAVVGPTLATVPVKTSINLQTTVGHFLDEVVQHTKDIEQFQHFGLQNIKALSIDAAQATDFQTLLAIHPRSNEVTETLFFSEKLLQYEAPPAYLLQVECQPTPSGFHVKAQYDPVVTSGPQIGRLLDQFEYIFSQLLSGDHTLTVGELEFCSPQDTRDIKHWNQDIPPRLYKCVHDVIFSHEPESTAVCSWDGDLTYRQLDELSTRLAYRLKTDFGVGPETLVPLTFTKSTWAVVAMMAVLKAGGGYVPMDPSYPASRLQEIVDACKASLILCSPQHEILARSLAGATLVVNRKTMDLTRPYEDHVDTAVRSDNTCYVIFTSGSTGTPKGVVMEHGGFSTAATEHGRRLDLNTHSRVIHFSSYAFEACILEILTTLFNGGCVCVAPESERLEDIAKTMRDLHVNWAFFTPSFIRTIRPDQVPDLKTLVLGGEALGADNIDVWVDKVHLINGYGPSETCVFSITNEHVRHGDTPDQIGSSIGGACWIVTPEDHGKLVPVGAVGELLIEGHTLARGYLNDLQKTSEVFVENSKLLTTAKNVNGKNGIKANGHTNGHTTNGHSLKRVMYKTGDLVRYNTSSEAKGTIRFVGRKDTQVKIRGQRMEPGDVEFHLQTNLTNVRHVAVEHVSLPGREIRFLAAFFSLEDQASSSSSEMVVLALPMSEKLKCSILAAETVLDQTLPSYMIPTLYIPLLRMPLLSSGKINRRELHQIVLKFSETQLARYTLADEQKRLPQSHRENQLAELWSSILQIGDKTSIGLDDSFFRLGGDSIGAMKLTTLAREHKILLNVATVFKNPKLENMAAATLNLKNEDDTSLEPFALLPETGNVETILDKISRDYNVFPGAIENVYPTGPLQEGLMLLSIKQPGSYMSQITLSLQSSVDLNRFTWAWQKTAERNAILRTRFAHTGSSSIQFVLKEDIKWAHASDLKTYLTEDKKKQMNHGDPLVRYAIIDAGNGDRHFVLTAHHSLYDGWSLMLIMDDFNMMFTGMVRPAAPPYVGFIKHLSDIDLDSAKSFWLSQFAKKSLASYPEPWTASQASVETQIFQFTNIERPLGSDITLSTIIRAAWALLVARYANTQDVFFGATLMGRNASLPNIERMTGPTITTLPICVSIDGSEAVDSYLQRVQNQGTDMIPFEHTGLQNIKSFGKEAEQACNFQNLLVIQPEGSEDLKSKVWKEEVLFAKGEMVTMTYALIVECRLYKEKVRITAQYREHITPTRQVQRMLDQFAEVMQRLNNSASSGLLVGDVQLLSEQDKQEIVEWNKGAPGSTPIDDCIHHIIQGKVAAQPRAPAIDSWDASFTYAELDAASTKVAFHLTSLGIGPGSYVPLCFDKSAWTIVAILAVLKAGGAYLSLDPKHPANRKELIIRDVRAKVILTSSQHKDLFDLSTYKVVAIDEASVEKLAVPQDETLIPGKSTDAAFVVFTSGSTGVPKGIVMEHGPFVSSARSHSKALRITSKSRVMQFAAYTYDVSMGEILTTLMQGGCVCVPSEEERMSNLRAAVNKLGVNWMFLTPTVAGFLKPTVVPGLETLVLGGEHATEDNIKIWAEHVYLINSYGPAETAIWCACAPGLDLTADPACFGNPVGASLWIVDANDPNKLAPIGTVGELVVEGPTLAREYLNDAKKTAAAFIENPKWSIDGSGKTRRMYRTGDLVRYGSSGNLLFVGRRDTQTKIHGQRIELKEIEHHLLRLGPPNWLPIVDILRFAEAQRDIVLCAFVHIRNAQNTSTIKNILPMTDELSKKLTRIRSQLELLLPNHMVPTAYIPVRILPLSAGGKVDRGALRHLGQGLTEQQLLPYMLNGQELNLPSTEMERKLQTLWAKVLNISPSAIGANSNFLRMGGDSVASMKLSAAAREMGLLLTMKSVFNSPRLDEMSRAVEVISTQEVKPYINFSTLHAYDVPKFLQDVILPNVASKAEDIEDVLMGMDYQRWTLGCGQLKTRGYNNYFIFHLKGEVDVVRLKAACRKLVDHHPVLRTVFVANKAELFQVVLKHVDTELGCHSYDGSDVPTSILQKDIDRPVPLESPSVRFLLVDQGREGHRLFMRASHSQYDGISFPFIVRDLKAAYLGKPFLNSLPYHLFIAGTRQTMRKSEALKFWQKELEGSTMTHVVDHQKPSFTNVVNKSLKRTISVPHTNKNDITFATMVKAAWSLALSHLSANSDIVFGQITTGRNASIQGIDEIVGPCMNLVPVRVKIDAITTYLDLLQQIQNQHLDMSPYESLGLQHIIHKCTSWPKWTRFSSILQHTNFNVGMESMDKWGDLEMHLSNFAPDHDVSDIWIWTGPVEDGFYVNFTYSEKTLPQSLAEEMVDMLCGHIKKMSEHLMSPIESALSKLKPRLPIQLEALDEENQVTNKSPAVEDAKALVLEVWKSVLGDEADDTLPTEVTDHSPFYEIRGDLLAAAQLSMGFGKHGYEISPEEIITHPTMHLQAALLSLKMQTI